MNLFQRLPLNEIIPCETLKQTKENVKNDNVLKVFFKRPGFNKWYLYACKYTITYKKQAIKQIHFIYDYHYV